MEQPTKQLAARAKVRTNANSFFMFISSLSVSVGAVFLDKCIILYLTKVVKYFLRDFENL